MSYVEVKAGLHDCFATIPALKAILDYEPTSIQTAPLVYSVLDGVERTVTGLTVRIVYRTMHRLCIRWQDSEAAEEQVWDLVDAIPRAVEADPKLGGRMRPGDAQIIRADAGWASIGGTVCRTIDFYSEVLEIDRYRGV